MGRWTTSSADAPQPSIRRARGPGAGPARARTGPLARCDRTTGRRTDRALRRGPRLPQRHRQAPAQAPPAARGRGSRAARPGLRRCDTAPGTEPRRRRGPGLLVEGREPAPPRASARGSSWPSWSSTSTSSRPPTRSPTDRAERAPRASTLARRTPSSSRASSTRGCASATRRSNTAASSPTRSARGSWAFGCDVCSGGLPLGPPRPRPRRAVRSAAGVRLGGGRSGETLEGLLAWGDRPAEGREAHFAEAFRGSPLRPAGAGRDREERRHRPRERPTDRGREALLRALERAAQPLVRAAAAWSLVRAHEGDDGVRAALDAAIRNETDAAAAADMRTSLERG